MIRDFLKVIFSSTQENIRRQEFISNFRGDVFFLRKNRQYPLNPTLLQHREHAASDELKDLTKKIVGTTAVFTVIIIMAIMFAGMVPGCGQASNGIITFKEGQLTYFKNRILVGTDASYPPFEFVRDGELQGFDIDIASEIAARLEKEIQIVPITWDFTYEIPEDTKLDMIISAVSATNCP